MFTPESERILEQIERLQSCMSKLVEERKSIRKGDILRNGYSITIAQLLTSIKELASKLPIKEKPTDGNQ